MSHSEGTGPEAWLAARVAAGQVAEQWRKVPGRSRFWVSDQGRVRTDKGRVLAQRPNNKPEGAPPELRYRLVDLWDPQAKRKDTVTVHSLVLAAFAGERPDGQEGCHLSGNPAWNWYPEGLAWGPHWLNESHKPPEVRIAAARAARAAQLAAAPRRRNRRRLRRVTLKLTFRLPWPQKKRRATAGSKPVSKPVTKEAA